ncbi:hypothetical protein H3146_07250 [Streptomyces sp. OF3]|uniref:Uncharacterized protein n=1 Tax=Streptomyces alkaliterrae TaxID=2213162 RepID=A0A7W3ZM63_9ACTN|nr:hypothetical protein [Streptomyces alkaliterrae]MBB1253166.1 hypothetical protein [Streptomyces alkaliterrae]
MAIPGNLLSATAESIDPNTSGWRARTNCTIASGTGGRNGPLCLDTVSVAAGEVRAETVSTYVVVPGETYQCFADAAGAQVERIGIEWLTASGTQVALTWSLTTATASTSWHRVGVAGVCPATATRARLVTSYTASGANVHHFWENFYLGLPKRSPGNLLSFNVESGGEVGLGGWAVETNGTLGRLVPPVGWGVNAYLAGAHVVTLTATGAGNTAMACTERPSAQPGVEYLAYAYLGPPTIASAAWIELRFADGAGNLIGTKRGPLSAPGTSLYRQRVSGIAPAGTAAAYMAVGIDSAAGGQVLRVEGAVITQAPDVGVTGSVTPYEDATFEAGVGSWTVLSGPATLARSTPHGAAGLDGSYSLTLTSASTGTTTIRSGLWPLGAGPQQWRWYVASQVAAGSWTMTRRVRWYDAAQVEISSVSSSPIAVPSPGWWSLSNDGPAPAGAEFGAIEYVAEATAAGSTLYLDRVALWRQLPLIEVTAHEATGSVGLVFRDLPVGAVMSLWRVDDTGQRALVRGPDGLLDRAPIVSDVLTIEDYEAPLGVPVRYIMERWTTGGAGAGTATTAIVTIPPGDRNFVWLKDVGHPQRNTRVPVERAPDWQRPIAQAEHRVRGARNTVVFSDVRGGLEGTLTVWTRSDEERHRLHWLLDSGHPLLVQAAPGMGVEDVYAAVGEVTEGRVVEYAPDEWRTWSLPLTEVDKPTTVGVAGTAGRTWQDVLTEHTTWEHVLGRYPTWEAVLLDRPRGGA